MLARNLIQKAMKADEPHHLVGDTDFLQLLVWGRYFHFATSHMRTPKHRGTEQFAQSYEAENL